MHNNNPHSKSYTPMSVSTRKEDLSLFAGSSASKPPSPPVVHASSVPRGASSHELRYDGSAAELFGLWLKTLFLTILTLGIYSFWGQTQIRKYLVGHLMLDGERFEYTGTGKELGYGFLKGLLIIGLIAIPYLMISDHDNISPLEVMILMLLVAAYVFVRYMSRYTAMRYRLSRGTWRGVRGALTGSAKHYAWLSLWHQFLNVITLGILIPRTDVNLRRYMIEHTYVGNVPVRFTPSPHGLMSTHLITGALALPTLFLSRYWYHAKLFRYLAYSTSIANVRFGLRFSGGGLLRFSLANYFILLCTLGLGAAWVMHRKMVFFTQNIELIGSFNETTFLQAADSKTTWGEGVVDVLNDASEGFL